METRSRSDVEIYDIKADRADRIHTDMLGISTQRERLHYGASHQFYFLRPPTDPQLHTEEDSAFITQLKAKANEETLNGSDKQTSTI